MYIEIPSRLRRINEELERKNTVLIEVLEQIEHQKNQIKNDEDRNLNTYLQSL